MSPEERYRQPTDVDELIEEMKELQKWRETGKRPPGWPK